MGVVFRLILVKLIDEVICYYKILKVKIFRGSWRNVVNQAVTLRQRSSSHNGDSYKDLLLSLRILPPKLIFIG